MLEVSRARSTFAPTDTFVRRHLGPDASDIAEMLSVLGFDSLEALIDAAVPAAIRSERSLAIGEPRGEFELLEELGAIAQQNRLMRSFIGMGYHATITPPVILRNVLENPGWYTQYTPYQAEIAQGRLEALLNFQTLIADLTGLPLANASLLDEATAAAEAMVMCRNVVASASPAGARRNVFIIDRDSHPQTIAVVRSHARSLGVDLRIEAVDTFDFSNGDCFGALVQSPATDGRLIDPSQVIRKAHEAGALVVMASDLLALTLVRPPGEWGADIAIGSSQRFGVPMGFGGPHAAFISTREEYARKMPGRIIGVSRDAAGRTALRMAIQTREQHIKRDRATSNICTAQVLLAIISGMYAVYHGPEGLRRIAQRIRCLAVALAEGLRQVGCETPGSEEIFDTVRVRPARGSADEIVRAAEKIGFNLRRLNEREITISLDEMTTADEVRQLIQLFGEPKTGVQELANRIGDRAELSEPFARRSGYLTHEVFNSHHSETEMLRYIAKLQSRDLSLAQSMIPLGSCTMKLNATSEMIPVTWPEFAHLHPFAPPEQSRGYQRLFHDLERWLADITGFVAVSLQPNAGSQGEYTGLVVIRAYHESRRDGQRDVCLIPVSAHGTNPASAVAAGFRVVPVQCDARGNIDLDDLRAQASKHAEQLGALMITYPSTHGVFEETIREVCAVIHEHGGQVYLDGANMNAMVGISRPAELGADVCHLNLHKTFCIPHGGGGPGMGPIAVAAQLAPFLPTHPVIAPAGAGAKAVDAIAAAPYGSACILTIPWMYIALMGSAGLRMASQVAILNANYMAKRLESHYHVLYRGPGCLCAHEFILDFRPFEKSAGVRIDDIAKRLMDYGFHAPTMSWPVPGTLMIEPTESESKAELDRFCDALVAIREEIRAIEDGKANREDNPLRNAPHTIEMLTADVWPHTYSREQAAFPLAWLRGGKFWPPVARVDNPFGDRNLVCTCPPMEAYGDA